MLQGRVSPHPPLLETLMCSNVECLYTLRVLLGSNINKWTPQYMLQFSYCNILSKHDLLTFRQLWTFPPINPHSTTPQPRIKL